MKHLTHQLPINTMEQSNSKRYVVEVQYDADTDDYYIDLPPEVLAETGWQPGDVLTWTDLGNQQWQLSTATSTTPTSTSTT